jgi:hypothetical protein
MMADEIQDLSDYRDAIEGLLLNGEELEATFPAALKTSPDSDEPQAIGITSHRVIVCHRRLRSGSSDRWAFRSILYSRVEELELQRAEQFHRDRIEASASVTLFVSWQGTGSGGRVELRYGDSVMAREVHDRILAHLLTLEARGLP